MKIDGTNLAEQIRKAVEKQGWSGYRLAKESGVSQPIVCRFLNGERDITLTTASKLAKVLGLALKLKKPTAYRKTKKKR